MNKPSPAWLAPASFLAAAFIIFGPSIGGEYVLDGALVVRDNPLLAPFDPVRVSKLDWWAGTGKPGGLYRPVALVWLGALRAMGGTSPAIVDFANVLLHGLVAWARFGLLVRLLGGAPRARLIAWLAAMLALVHPLGVEVVCGQVGASDLLATLLATVAVVVGCGRHRSMPAGGPQLAKQVGGSPEAGGPHRRRVRSAAAAGGLAALAALSKESAVAVVPAAILCALLRADSRNRGREAVRAAAWSCAGVAVALGLRFAALGPLAGADDPVYAGFPAVARIASACAAFGTYLAPLLIAPWRQMAVVSLQDAWPAEGFGDWRAWLGLTLLAALAAGPVLTIRRKQPAIAFGCWTFLAWWLPASNLAFSSGAVAASRFFYPGLIGLALALAMVVVGAWDRGGLRKLAAAALVAWFGIAMAVITIRELPAWSSPRALYEAQVARAPGSSYSLVDLGSLLAEKEPSRAIRLFEAAVAAPRPRIPGTGFAPEDLYETVFIAHTRLGQLRFKRGDLAGAGVDFAAAELYAALGIEAKRTLPFCDDWDEHLATARSAAQALAAATRK